ncbi:MAG: DUF3987 domain-containing protein [Planctomycetes bacterium]|nr:DUF3987 domain-containing protein [Planctomycetota bacterium]
MSLASANDNLTKPSDLAAVHRRIVGTDLCAITGAVRAAPDREARNQAKRKLPGFIPAGLFSARRRDAWETPSGLLVADFDKVPDLDRLRTGLAADPCVALLFTSPSGTGCKAVLRVPVDKPDPAQHARAFAAAERWASEAHGATLDPSGKDPGRLCYICHDPTARLRLDAQPLDLDRWARPAPVQATPPPRAVPEAEAERRALAYVRAMPPSVQGANGSAALVAAVRSMRDGFDLTGARLWRCLDAWNVEHASPPWTRAELEHALASVEQEPAKRGRGWLLKSDPWPEPTPIRSAEEPPPFDLLTMIPADLPTLRDLVDLGSEALQVPRELIAGAAVGLAALACSRAVEVEPQPGWREPAPLWVLPLLRPGERKSASLGMLTRPFHDWTAGERQYMAAPLARYMERRRGMEVELAALRAKAAKGAGEPATRARAAALDLAAELEAMPAKLAAPDLLAQSYTPEGLRDLLEANGERVGIVSAEADAAELMGARYSDAGPSIDLLLCAHAGDPITTRRAGGRAVQLDRPAVGMVLAVQPEAVRAVLADRAAKGRGLIDRMLLILPPSRMGSRLLDPPPLSAAMSDWWASGILRLLNLPWPGRCTVNFDGEPTRCTAQPRILGLDSEARAHLWRLRADLEPRLAEGADLAAVSGFASKLPGACARLALAFTMLRDPGAAMVGGEAMRAACAWAPFLLAHHRAVLGNAAELPEAHHARRLWRALQRRGLASMTARDLFDLARDSALPTMAEFRPVLDLLAEHGAVRPAPGEDSRPGRPAERWDVHPSLLVKGFA